MYYRLCKNSNLFTFIYFRSLTFEKMKEYSKIWLLLYNSFNNYLNKGKNESVSFTFDNKLSICQPNMYVYIIFINRNSKENFAILLL